MKQPITEDTTIIIYGPPASGKTLNGERLRQHYGRRAIVDEGKVAACGAADVPQGSLVLTNLGFKRLKFKFAEPADVRVISIETVARECPGFVKPH